MLRRPIFFIVTVVILLFVFGWIIFTIPWGGSNSAPGPVEEQKKLADYADTDLKVSLNQNGAIVSDQNHREVWITVSRGEVTAEVKQGYEGTTIKSERFANNTIAYGVFLAALEGQGFTQTRNYRGNQTEQGACPSGIRYIFNAYSSSEDILHSWATSCSGKAGTFDGKLTEVNRLFQRQLPDYAEFIEGVNLRP